MAIIRLRRGTSIEWEARNPTLARGEPGVESDTDRFKIGDGDRDWLSLPYYSSDTYSETLNMQDLTLLWENAIT